MEQRTTPAENAPGHRPTTPTTPATGSTSSASTGGPQPRLRVPQPVNVTGGTSSGGNGRSTGLSSPDPANRAMNPGPSGSLRQDVLVGNLRSSASARRDQPDPRHGRDDSPPITPDEMAQALDRLRNDNFYTEYIGYLRGRNTEHISHFQTIIERVEESNKDIKNIMDRMELYYGRLVEELHSKLYTKEKILASTIQHAEREMAWLYRCLFFLVGMLLILLGAVIWKMD